MSDQPTDRPATTNQPAADQPTDQPTDHDWMTIDEAAAALGITANAVRQRIKRHTLAAEKTAGGWLVAIDRPSDQPSDRPTNQPPTSRPRPTDRPIEQVPTAVDLTPLADLIKQQQDEIRRLAEAAAVWQLRAIQAEDRIRLLEAGAPSQEATRADEETDTKATQPEPAPEPPLRRSWWRRLFLGEG